MGGKVPSSMSLTPGLVFRKRNNLEGVLGGRLARAAGFVNGKKVTIMVRGSLSKA
jgi:hypothetical protein